VVWRARVARATARKWGKDHAIAELQGAEDELLKKLLLRHERIGQSQNDFRNTYCNESQLISQLGLFAGAFSADDFPDLLRLIAFRQRSRKKGTPNINRTDFQL
jgi:hypothetical protein